MDAYKLRIKIGPHEFEAEGQKDAVNAQFEDWKKLVESLSHGPQFTAPPKTHETSHNTNQQPSLDSSLAHYRSLLAPVFDLDEKRGLVTLRVLPSGDKRHSDAILLILYGYRKLRGQDEVLVTRLKSSLESSGSSPGRIDRAAESYKLDGSLVKSGSRTGGKYRLTNKGMARAEGMVKTMLEQFT